MLIIRLSYTSPMPTPSEILSRLPNAPSPIDNNTKPNNSPGATYQPDKLAENNGADIRALNQDMRNKKPANNSETVTNSPIVAPKIPSQSNTQMNSTPFKDLRHIAEYCEQKGALILASDIRSHVKLVRLEECHLEIDLVKHASEDLPGKIAQFLNTNTTDRWLVSISDKSSSPTLQKTDEIARQKRLSVAAEHPLAKKVLETFPGAKVTDVITPIDNEMPLSSTLLAETDLIENPEPDIFPEHSDNPELSDKKEKMYDA